jgi:phenylpropionate dioxygenase-like ring-hydroxylating dioxygenase large terminal subunit
MTWAIDRLVRDEEGLVEPVIFADEEIYRQERTKVFPHCWLFVGLESQVAKPGDYLSTNMGEDAVITIRDKSGRIRVFLNKCRHRGNKVCLFDRGTALAFRCTYHGWTFANDGSLISVPAFQESYLGALDRAQWGLIEVPRVESFAGFIFACWDERVMPLQEYLGDMGWYLEYFLGAGFVGGLEIVPGVQRYLMPGNWKLCCDNFAGDHYHFPATHAAVRLLNQEYQEKGLKARGLRGTRVSGTHHEVTPGWKAGVPHAVGSLRPGRGMYEDDLRRAADIGPEAVDWVKYRYERLQAALEDHPVLPYSMTRGHVFPNFSQIGLASVLEARGLILWTPRGPNASELWEWCAVEREAPRCVKESAVVDLVHGQSAAGLVGPDDHENFERMQDNLQTPIGQSWAFNYQMTLGREDTFPGRETWQVEGLPGLVGHHTTEVSQRQFYRYWKQLMMREDDGRNGHFGVTAGNRDVPVRGGAASR